MWCVCCFYCIYDLTHNTRYVFGNLYGSSHQVQANVNGVDNPRQNVVVRCMWVHEGSTDNNFRVCNRGYNAHKFTLSRTQRTDKHGVVGIGWTENGMNKSNDIYDLVKEDRISRGETFNAE